jgi:lipooligosaccharide transport system permease protein
MTMIPQLSLRAFAVWRRNFLVWKKLAIPSLLGNLADPMIYLFGLLKTRGLYGYIVLV